MSIDGKLSPYESQSIIDTFCTDCPAQWLTDQQVFLQKDCSSMSNYFATFKVLDISRTARNSGSYLYKTSSKLRSNVTCSNMTCNMNNGDRTASTYSVIAKQFNFYFTPISSISFTADKDCQKFRMIRGRIIDFSKRKYLLK